jgi:hypothetical protein
MTPTTTKYRSDKMTVYYRNVKTGRLVPYSMRIPRLDADPRFVFHDPDADVAEDRTGPNPFVLADDENGPDADALTLISDALADTPAVVELTTEVPAELVVSETNPLHELVEEPKTGDPKEAHTAYAVSLGLKVDGMTKAETIAAYRGNDA